MFTGKLAVLLLFATITCDEVASYDKIWTARHKRDADHSRNQIVHGSTNQQIQNKFEFAGQAQGSDSGTDSTIITGSITSQSKNNHTDIGHADNVYVVLPRWNKVRNQLTPSNPNGNEGIQMTSERRDTVQRAINMLKQECRGIKDKLDELTSGESGLDNMFRERTEAESRRESKIDRIHKNYLSLEARVRNQQSLLDVFSSETPWVLLDNFNEDLNSLQIMIDRVKLKLLALS